ncbi:hypothetical protein IT411_00735 [Candidatus Peregrinibacteria bacterium]|nr:hypothetical protein [Candidatus Peregrinibacteria bacterium]
MANNNLTSQLHLSTAFQLLVPTYQNFLEQLISDQSAFDKTKTVTLKKALGRILDRENTNDLQNIFFTEKLLEDFVEKYFTLPAYDVLKPEFREKAAHLVNRCLFLTAEQKENIVNQLDTVNLTGLKQIIALYREGHHKQFQYLQIFAEKDLNNAAKFSVLVEKALKPKIKK